MEYFIESGILLRHTPSHTLKLLYYSLFCSFHVWSLTHPSIILNPLYELQKMVVCTICFEDKYAHTTPLFCKLKTLKFHGIHCLKLLCFVYDCTKDQPITYFDNFFTLLQLVHQHFTHQASKGNFFRHACVVNTSQYGIGSAKYTGTILWTNLPMHIKDSSSKVIFKKELQKLSYSLC